MAGAQPALPPGQGGEGGEGRENALESTIDLKRVEGRVKESSMKKIAEIVEKHPEETVSILRNWMYRES